MIETNTICDNESCGMMAKDSLGWITVFQFTSKRISMEFHASNRLPEFYPKGVFPKTKKDYCSLECLLDDLKEMQYFTINNAAQETAENGTENENLCG